MPPDPGRTDRGLRASDADREQVAAELGDHLEAGRLDTAEFEERLNSAYAARTLGELDTLLTDLPPERAQPAGAPAMSLEKPVSAVPQRTPGAAQRPVRYGSWLSVSLIVLAVWGISSLAAGDLQRFWPVWVIGPWGLALLLGRIRRTPRGPDRPD